MKIFLEVISNAKILSMKFFNEVTNNQDFHKLTRGLNKLGEPDSVEYGKYISFILKYYFNFIN